MGKLQIKFLSALTMPFSILLVLWIVFINCQKMNWDGYITEFAQKYAVPYSAYLLEEASYHKFDSVYE